MLTPSTFRKKNRLPEALKMLERCIALEPRFVQAYLELLHLRPEDKRWILNKLLELEPENWEHYVLYGDWMRDRGRYFKSRLRLYVREEFSRFFFLLAL